MLGSTTVALRGLRGLVSREARYVPRTTGYEPIPVSLLEEWFFVIVVLTGAFPPE